MTEPLTVVFELRAAREVEDIDAWWRANREAAPDVFMSELERIVAILVLVPSVGAPARSERIAAGHSTSAHREDNDERLCHRCVRPTHAA